MEEFWMKAFFVVVTALVSSVVALLTSIRSKFTQLNAKLDRQSELVADNRNRITRLEGNEQHVLDRLDGIARANLEAVARNAELGDKLIRLETHFEGWERRQREFARDQKEFNSGFLDELKALSKGLDAVVQNCVALSHAKAGQFTKLD